MQTINGIGTTVYGADYRDPLDDSYVTTKWIVILYLPIYPLESMRVIRIDEGGWFSDESEYQVVSRVSLHTKQVVKTYIIRWSIAALLLSIIFL